MNKQVNGVRTDKNASIGGGIWSEWWSRVNAKKRRRRSSAFVVLCNLVWRKTKSAVKFVGLMISRLCLTLGSRKEKALKLFSFHRHLFLRQWGQKAMGRWQKFATKSEITRKLWFTRRCQSWRLIPQSKFDLH